MKWIPILAALAATACHRDQRPPAPSADQANQLNEMDDALNGLGPDNEEGPAANATGPSSFSNSLVSGPSRK